MSINIEEMIGRYFIQQEFKKEVINGKNNYKYKNGHYYIVTHDKGYYYIEGAPDKEHAGKNLYDDVDQIPREIGEEEVIEYMKLDIQEYIIDRFKGKDNHQPNHLNWSKKHVITF